MKHIVMIISLFLLFSVGLLAQPGKYYKEAITAHDLTVIDECFIHALDSIVFKGGLSQIKEGKLRVFNVTCKPKENKEDEYIIHLDLRYEVYLNKDFRGCFTYNDYLFCWHGLIPECLLQKTGGTRQLTTLRNYLMFEDNSEYEFEYSCNNVKLISVFCY